MPQNDRNFNAMRQDAIRRSREMQRRARPDPAPPPPEPHPEPPPAPPPPPPPPPLIPGLTGELGHLLHDWDGEKIALAALLYLLWKEGADPALLLAIGYILL
ncbi:MAG: hypothetical protein IJV58_07300 [Oscillospiraceae bacterium]|nr:hypothetical protein [Oscillospiraceae bacterium]